MGRFCCLLGDVGEVPVVGLLDTLLEGGRVVPAELVDLGNIEELARGAVRLRGVPDERTGESDDFFHGLCEFTNGDVFASPDIDRTRLVVVLHEEHTGLREVVGVEEFTLRSTGAPAHDFLRTGDLRFMEALNQTREDVRMLGVVVVVFPVEVGRHRTDEVLPELLAIGITHSDACNLGKRIGVIGRLERTREEMFLLDRLRGHARVDTGTSEEEQLRDIVVMRAGEHVECDGQILRDEVDREGAVGDDAADLRGRDEDEFRTLARKEVDNGFSVEEVEFGSRTHDDVGVAFGLEVAHDGRAYKATVSGDEDLRILKHGFSLRGTFCS